MPVQPLVSIVISNHNGADLLRECLNSLRRQTYRNFEVIVVDAGSTDGAPEMVEREFKEVRVIRQPRIGVGEALNLGILEARGDAICFDVNNDDVLEENWLARLVETLYSSEDVGVVCGKRLYPGTDVIDSAGGEIRHWIGAFPPRGRGMKDSDAFRGIQDVDYTMVVMMRRSLLRIAGLCDTIYEHYYGDTDISYRVKKMGYRVVCDNRALQWHGGSSLYRSRDSRAVGYSQGQLHLLVRSRIRFVLKNFPSRYLLPALLLTIPSGYGEYIRQMILHRSHNRVLKREMNLRIFLGYVRSILSAATWNILHLRETMIYRRSLDSIVSVHAGERRPV